MGTVASKAANGLGVVLGNAFTAPLKAVFGASCEGVCAGTWDLPCFIEHLCVSNILKLVMVFILTYITLLFLYLLFKLGLIQCIIKSLCKMGWAACETYWYAMSDITCFLCHKLKNTKRVHKRRHRRFKDIEQGYSSSEDDMSRGRQFSDRRKDRKHHGRTKHSGKLQVRKVSSFKLSKRRKTKR